MEFRALVLVHRKPHKCPHIEPYLLLESMPVLQSGSENALSVTRLKSG